VSVTLPNDSDADSPAKRGSAFASFRHRDFSVFWVSALSSNIGNWMQIITVPYALDQLTHSTTVVGVGAFLTFFPRLLVTPIAGSLADRYSRRNVLFWSQVVMMLAAFGLWALWTTNEATPANLLVCVVIAALGNGITLAAWQSFVTQLVPPEDMFNAIRWNSIQFAGGRTFGPAVAGFVLATAGPGAAFFANGVSFVIVLLGLLLIPSRPVADIARAKVWTHFSEGVRYVRERRVLAIAVLTWFMFSILGQSMAQLIEPFNRRILHFGAGKYGVLVSMLGAGGILGSLGTLYERVGRSRMTMFSAVTFIVGLTAFGLAPNYLFALVAVIALGIAFNTSAIALQTAVQANVDETHRGRVMAIYMVSIFGGVPVGALLGGVAGDLVGLRATFVAFAFAFTIFLVYANAAWDHFRLLDQSIEHTEQIRSESHPQL
jgi:MFS family permease